MWNRSGKADEWAATDYLEKGKMSGNLKAHRIEETLGVKRFVGRDEKRR